VTTEHLTPPLEQKGPFLLVPACLTRATALSQIHISGRSSGLHHLFRSQCPFKIPPIKKKCFKRSDHTHGTLTCRSSRAVARVPGRIAESGCTMRATRHTAGPTANAPPAARTGGELETRGSSPLAKKRRLKTIGRAGREGVPQRKATTNGKATQMLPRLAVLLLLGLLKHRQRVATSSALRAPGNRCHCSAKLVPHLMTFFSVPIIQEWMLTETRRSLHEQGDGERAVVVEHGRLLCLKSYTVLGGPPQYSRLCTLHGLINVDILPSG
jgi:hypothetical protein